MPNPESPQPITETRAGDETSEAGEFVEPRKTPVELADERLKDKLLDSEAEIQRKSKSGEITQEEADNLLANIGKLAENLVGLPLEKFSAERLKRLDNKFLSEIIRLYEEGAHGVDVAQSLAGLGSDRAWQFRQQLINDGVDIKYIARGLAGLGSDRAWQMRNKLIESGCDEEDIVKGLAGLDSDKAWELRIVQEAKSKFESVLCSLAGLDSDRAWQMREKLLEEGASIYDIAHSLAGLDSDRAWKMRERLLKSDVGKGFLSLLLSFAGDFSSFVWRLNYGKKEWDAKS